MQVSWNCLFSLESVTPAQKYWHLGPAQGSQVNDEHNGKLEVENLHWALNIHLHVSNKFENLRKLSLYCPVQYNSWWIMCIRTPKEDQLRSQAWFHNWNIWKAYDTTKTMTTWWTQQAKVWNVTMLIATRKRTAKIWAIQLKRNHSVLNC